MFSSSAHTESSNFRSKVGKLETEETRPRLLATLKTTDSNKFYSPPVYNFLEIRNASNKNYLLRGDCNGRISLWNIESNMTNSKNWNY